MTTVYIDKRCGLVITDSRVTSTEQRAFLGIFPLREKKHYFVTSQKSMYVHDRLFTSCGSLSEIDKVLNYLCYGTPVIPSRKNNCHCVLLDKEYCIHLIVHNGKFIKKTEFIDNNYKFSMGSGSPYMDLAIDAIPGLVDVPFHEYVLNQFMKVHTKDEYTDDNIIVYKI